MFRPISPVGSRLGANGELHVGRIVGAEGVTERRQSQQKPIQK